MLFDVLPWSQVNGLIQGIALGKGIQVAAFDYLTHRRNVEVGGDGDVAYCNPALPIEQTQFHAPLVVDPGDHSRTGGVELVLELVPAAVGSARGVRSIEPLEHHALLPLSLQMTEQALFVGRVRGDLGKLDVRDAAAKLPDETMSDLSDNDNVEAIEDEPFEEEALV